MTCGTAVEQGIIANESLAYYLARTFEFCKAIGIDMARLRFRQHLNTEMAHYATDCWDLEIKLSSGWVECAGHADRSCYDLSVHAKKSKVEMVGTHKFDKPEKRQIVEIKPNKGKMGRTFKADVDTSSVAIGRKYARADELGIPFGVTIDFDTVKDRVVTLRERDSTAQVRIPMDVIGAEVSKLIKGSATWEQMLERYPKVTAAE
eukprot:jgi/Phyca11/537817/estExt2_fgenesh1_pg.C_PHYCAscaffold_2080001